MVEISKQGEEQRRLRRSKARNGLAYQLEVAKRRNAKGKKGVRK